MKVMGIRYPLVILLFWVIAALVSPWSGLTPDEIHLDKILAGPDLAAWLGHDDLGRNILARLLAGARVSLAVAAVAVRHPDVSVIIPHFGAGLFREALMAADEAPNILLDTSSSNGWIKFHPGLTLREAFARALDVVGPSRLLFGTDSSFYPRGWHREIYDTQRAIVTDLGVSAEDQALLFGGNFARVFPA